MNRRDFLKRSVPVSILPGLLGGFTFKAYGRSPLIDLLLSPTTTTNRVLVLIQLNGGNDGLNTVIPLDQYSSLSRARSNILIDESKVLPLTDTTGLHPAMTGLHKLYHDGKLCIVQGVGYPNPNLSHFRATDIFLTAADSNQTLTSGWMGRYLHEEYPGFPEGYPNPATMDPLALQIGSVVSPGLQGPSVSMGMAITSPTSFYQLVSGGVDTAPDTRAGHELTFLRRVAQQTQQYATTIQKAASKAMNLSPLYPNPGTNALADQLKIVAQLIMGGLRTRMYIVNIGGFDTHSDQVDSTAGTDAGTHATLLSRLSIAITAFMDDIRRMGLERRVVGMTFSEFGRRIISNASDGTDHGTSAPMILFGSKVNAAIIGSNPILPSNPTVTDNLPMQFDFRSVYGSVLHQWLNTPQDEVDAILLKGFPILPLIQPPGQEPGFKPDPAQPPIGKNRDSGSGVEAHPVMALHANYPNPFNPSTRISFSSDGGYIVLRVFDSIGREIRRLVDGRLAPGRHEAVFEGGDLPSGLYHYRLESDGFHQSRTMLLVK